MPKWRKFDRPLFGFSARRLNRTTKRSSFYVTAALPSEAVRECALRCAQVADVAKCIDDYVKQLAAQGWSQTDLEPVIRSTRQVPTHRAALAIGMSNHCFLMWLPRSKVSRPLHLTTGRSPTLGSNAT